MKFLVVDDHELIREAMRGALKQLDSDATILEASQSCEAMEAIEAHADLDLVLLDLNLPDRDGFSVLIDLRKSHPSISVVVMSAQQDRDSVVRALQLGALGFIPKSAPRKVILGALQLVNSGGIYIPPQALAQEPSSPPSLPKVPGFPAAFDAELPAAAPADLGLTDRQVDVLALMMKGKSNKAICRLLDLSEPTVKSHVSAILKALKVSNRTEAVIAVSELKWTLPPVSNS
jgi:DNA-binding NarL/FixJ family response regulator